MDSPLLTLVLHGLGTGIALCVLAWLLVPVAVRVPGRWPLFGFTVSMLAGYLLELPAMLQSQDIALRGAEVAYWPFLPVTLWLYVRALTGEPVKARNHVLRAVGLLVFLLPLLTLPEDQWRLAESSEVTTADTPVWLMLAGVSTLLYWVGWMSVLTGYGWAMVQQLRSFDQRLGDNFADSAAFDRHGTRRVLWLTAIAVLITLADQVLTLAELPNMPDWTDSLFRTLVLLGFAVSGLMARPLPDWGDEDATLEQGNNASATTVAPSPMPETPAPSAPAYARSSLTDADCERILAKARDWMAQNQGWRESDLTLAKLAVKIGVKPNYLSQALNTRAQSNFFDFVNRYRIDEACELLRSTEDTAITICHAVGFNAKSTFNAAFRRFIGQTPLQYRRTGEHDLVQVTAPAQPDA